MTTPIDNKRNKKKESRDKDTGIAQIVLYWACTANVLLEVENIVPHRFIQARPGFEANGMEVQLHVDMRMRQNAGINSDHEIKIRENLYPRNILAIQ